MSTTTTDTITRHKNLQRLKAKYEAEIRRIEALKVPKSFHAEKLKTCKRWLREHEEEIRLVGELAARANADEDSLRIARIVRIPINKRLRIVKIRQRWGTAFDEDGRMWCKPDPRLKPGRLCWVEKREDGDVDEWVFVRELKGEMPVP